MSRALSVLGVAPGSAAGGKGLHSDRKTDSEVPQMFDDRIDGLPSGPQGKRMSVIFAASFVVFLAVAIFASLLGRQWSDWLPGTGRHTSMLEGVRGAVYDVMPFLM